MAKKQTLRQKLAAIPKHHPEYIKERRKKEITIADALDSKDPEKLKKTVKANRWRLKNSDLGAFAVSHALHRGQLDMLKMLQELGIDFEKRANNVIRIATRRGHQHIVEWIQNDIQLSSLDGNTLAELAEDGKLRELKKLDKDLSLEFNNSVIMSAAVSGNPKLVKWLVEEKGVSVKTRFAGLAARDARAYAKHPDYTHKRKGYQQIARYLEQKRKR